MAFSEGACVSVGAWATLPAVACDGRGRLESMVSFGIWEEQLTLSRRLVKSNDMAVVEVAASNFDGVRIRSSKTELVDLLCELARYHVATIESSDGRIGDQ